MFGFVSNEEKAKNKETFIQSVLLSFGEKAPQRGEINLMEWVEEDSRNKELRNFAEGVFEDWKIKGYLNHRNLLDEKKIQEA